MEIQLMQGVFNSNDAIEFITKMIQINLKYYEDNIKNDNNEEDIKIREVKIKNLQKELYQLRQKLNSKKILVKVDAKINIDAK